MRPCRRSLRLLAGSIRAHPATVSIALLWILVGTEARAQARTGPEWSVTPSIGLAMIANASPRDGTDLESGGATIQLEVDLRTSAWNWSAYVARRGLGVGCSHGCAPRAISATGIGVARRFGPFSAGGGLGGGYGHESGQWHLQPHAQVSWTSSRIMLQTRFEFPSDTKIMHVPILVGFRVPIAGESR